MTTKPAKHTPTPYKASFNVEAEDGGTSYTAEVTTINNELVCRTYGDTKAETKANARFIVRTCNSHEELLEACKDTLDALKITTLGNKLPQYITQLEQAITKAEAL